MNDLLYPEVAAAPELHYKELALVAHMVIGALLCLACSVSCSVACSKCLPKARLHLLTASYSATPQISITAHLLPVPPNPACVTELGKDIAPYSKLSLEDKYMHVISGTLHLFHCCDSSLD